MEMTFSSLILIIVRNTCQTYSSKKAATAAGAVLFKPCTPARGIQIPSIQPYIGQYCGYLRQPSLHHTVIPVMLHFGID